MNVKLLTEHHLEFLSLEGGSTVSSESTLVKSHIVGNHVSRLNSMSVSLSNRPEAIALFGSKNAWNV